MPIGKLFGVNPALGTSNPFQVNKQADNNRFAQNAFNFENANPNCPEHRGDGVHGLNLYCLA